MWSSNNQNKAHFSSDILVSTQIHVYAYHTYVHYPSIYVYSVLLCGSMYTLDSSRTWYKKFVCARYNYKAAAAAATTCGCGARREGAGICYGERYVWIRPSYEACVCLSCFVSCHNLPSYHKRGTTGQHNERGNWISKAAAPQPEQCTEYTYIGVVHNQPQRYTTAASRDSPTSCVCDSHGEYVCVVCVYTVHRSAHACMMCMSWGLN